MVKIDTEAFKKAGYTYEQIQQIIKSEEDFERTGICYTFDEVKELARDRLINNSKVKCIK